MNENVNVLIVDDRAQGLITLEAALADLDCNLIRAESGKEALTQILLNDFAVIIMDVQMPDMDGFETASIIKQRAKSKFVPIIFMTANNEAEHFVNVGYSVGAVDYIFKPFNTHVLRSKVSVFIDLYKKNRQLLTQAELLRNAEAREQAQLLIALESEGRRRYQNLADAIPQIIWRAGKNRNFEYFNQFWHQYTGLTLEKSIVGEWREVFYPSDVERFEKLWNEASLQNKGFDCECRFRRASDRQFRWHLIRILPEFNSFMELACWIGTATDIHDQKMIQQELVRAKKLSDSASEAKTRFLANMSHEIRTPLGAILGFSELLADTRISEGERTEYITTVRRNGELLTKIIDEILDLSKIEAGKLDVEIAEVDLVDLLRNVKDLMLLSAQNKNLDLTFKLTTPIPISIETNATRFQQVLVNIIGNAIKFTQLGQIEVRISCKDMNTHQMIIIEVQDSGPGLSEEQIGNLFQPFSQVDASVTRKFGGTGLGLALSRKLAKALRGDLIVKSSVLGEGSTFEFSIHAGPPQPDTQSVKTLEFCKIAAPTVQTDKVLSGCHILLVEDSEDNQVLVSRFLEVAGAQVEVANNGLEGVTKALQSPFDLVLMDIQMPVLDGYGAIDLLKQKKYKTPVVALTAHGMSRERLRCRKAGFSDHLTKPIDREMLITRVRELIQTSRSAQEALSAETIH